MDIIEIAKIIEKNGGRLYLVGGAIRDKLLGKQVHDEDYCVTGLSKNEFEELFPNSSIRGKAFEVFEINGKEFALARKERKIGIGHKEFEIETGKEITIVDDLARRDITINSIAQDVLAQKIIDPFNGRNDIDNKIIRATTNAFKEDPLRVYRVARFAANLGFRVEQSTIELMHEVREELITLSKERVFSEFRKALSSERPSIFFDVLRDAKVLDVHFKEIYDLIGSLQPEKYHPEGDSYNHTMLVLDKAAQITENLEIRFSALVHDLGKGITPKELYPHHYGHDINGVELVQSFGKRIGIPKSWMKCGKTAAKEHMLGGIFGRMSPAKKVKFIERIDKSILGLNGLQIVVIADRTGRGTYKETRKEKEDSEFEEIAKKCLKEINAQYVMKKYNLEEGKLLGERLHQERIEWIKNFRSHFIKNVIISLNKLML